MYNYRGDNVMSHLYDYKRKVGILLIYSLLISEQNMKFCENIIIFIFYSVIFIGLSFGDVQGKKWHNHTINVQTFLVEIWNNDNNNNKKIN